MLTLAQHGAIGDPAALAAAGTGTQTLVAVAALVGFGTKAGLVPLHSWLPRAHPVAPAHLSALMSGVMIKVALYGLIRVEFEWLGATPRWLGITLLALGLLSALGGVLWALVQHDLKRLLAFHSIENVGIIALGLGASMLFARAGAREWAAIAFAAALLHVANHAIFKALLFLGAGAFERAVGALELDRLGGLLRRMPWTGGAFLVGLDGDRRAAAAERLRFGVADAPGARCTWRSEPPVGVALAAGRRARRAGGDGRAGAAVLREGRRARAARGRHGARSARPRSRSRWAMRAGMAALALLCVVIGVVPGLLVPTLAGLAPGASDDVLPRHAGLDRARHRLACRPGARGRALALGGAARAGARDAARGAGADVGVRADPVARRCSGPRPASPSRCGSCSRRCCARAARSRSSSRAAWWRAVTYSSEVPSLADAQLYEPADPRRAARGRRRAPPADRQRPHVRRLSAGARPRPARAGPHRSARMSSLAAGALQVAGVALAPLLPGTIQSAQGAPAGAPRRIAAAALPRRCGGCGARAPSTPRAPGRSTASPRRWRPRACSSPSPSCRSAGAPGTGGSATTRSCWSALLALARFARRRGGVGHRQRLRADGRRPRPDVRGLRRGAARARAARRRAAGAQHRPASR